MRFSLPLHPAMGDAVLAQLRRLAHLPAHGFVAGQAVASALDDLYGKGGGVYNDVDVFIRAPRFTKPRERLVVLPSRFTAELSLQPPPGSDYGHLPNQHTLVSAPTYTISGVRRRDLLNEVFYTTAKVLGSVDSARCVLTSFDINAVRVGVDIASGQLIWDADFAQFARTGELRLCALHTPYHSLVRLLRKSRELPNVTANIEASASLVAVLSAPDVRRSIEKQGAATFWFGARYAEQACAVRSDLAPYFSMRTQHRFYDEIFRKVRPGFGDETSMPYELSTLQCRGKTDVPDSRHSGDELLDMLTLPREIYGRFDAPCRAGIVVPASVQKVALSLVPLAVQHQLAGSAYLGTWSGATAGRLRTLSKLLAPRIRVASHLLGLNAESQLTMLEEVQARLSAAGVPDVDHILDCGVAYDSAVDADSWMRGCEVRLRMERKYELARMGVPVALDDSVWAEWPGAEVSLLASERQLREWCARHDWEVPAMMSGKLWIGVNMGRHQRDTSLLNFSVGGTTRLLGRRSEFKRRFRMPVALQAAHKKLRILLCSFARCEGWFAKS